MKLSAPFLDTLEFAALSFWNLRKRHANWIVPQRTRVLPARARPSHAGACRSHPGSP
jgi:hypothetical protein